MVSEKTESPFHRGEQAIQERLGVRDNMEKFGRMVIRDYMPQQHQEFYQQLPFILIGHADQNGEPWASILCKPAGFIQSPNNKTLQINASLINGDPLANTLKLNQKSGIQTKLGLLGIELPTRRRNRMAAHVTRYSDQQIQLEVDQAFGNCPQYIQSRELKFISDYQAIQTSVEDLTTLDEKAIDLIENSDTFFIASYVDSKQGKISDGADISHRGGRPGFVRVNDNQSITIPDYLGNNHFNTFGNIAENAKAGILFVDFETGDILTMTGRASINWDSPDIKYFEGAQRLLEFTLTDARWLKNGLPVRWGKADFSQNSLLTGTWSEARRIEQAETKRNQWLDYKVVAANEESANIRSLYLQPISGQKLSFKPGQFLTVKAEIESQQQIRTYTLSSAPSDPLYRISVKRETSSIENLPDGLFSNYLHDEIKVGDVIQARAPNGHFYFDSSKLQPVLLLAAGIGITPMISILRQALVDAVKTRHLRPITLIAVARNERERAFYQELKEVVKSTDHQINVYWCLTRPEEHLRAGVDFDIEGRPDKNTIEQLIRHSDHDAYICGPGAFMQSSYDGLREIGLVDSNIFAEAFGPSSLQRDNEQLDQNTAEEALVNIKTNQDDSTVEQRWTDKNGSLLELLESHGMSPSYGCRSGQCGSCKAKITKGNVVHFMPTAIELKQDELLLCCAKPKRDSQNELAEITLIVQD